MRGRGRNRTLAFSCTFGIAAALSVLPTLAYAASAAPTPTSTLPPLHGKPIVAVGNAPEPRFNRVHPYEEIADLLKAYAAAYPKWTRLESLGKSIQGRDMWMITVQNSATGPELAKPAMYIDGNIHANEVQGAETALYTVDFLLKNYGKLDRVTDLLDRAVFYVLPVVNPDGRALWFGGPSDPNYPRTVMVPVDDDRDGKVDEDGPDDLDGDGLITEMRKKVPLGQGTHRLDPKDPRILVPVAPGELGDYLDLGPEGIDNDGDGQINEDGPGYVDPNRTGGYYWQPPYVQNGAGNYPLAIPETRSIALWALKHPNLAAVQSYHNNGKLILRGPDAKEDPPYPPGDIRVYDLIGKEGEKMLPGYKYQISWKDLYPVHGSTTGHFYGVHGVIAFTNELYDEPADFNKDGVVSDEERMKFNDLLTLGRQFVPWHPYHHPQYGDIEIGGFRKDVGRVPEGWLLEEETHRNNAFALLHAYHMPLLSIGDVTVKKLGSRLYRLEVPVLNERAIPTVTAYARQNKLHRFDLATVEGGKVLASGVVDDPYLEKVQLQEHRANRLVVPGVPGLGTRLLFFLVEGDGDVTVHYDSLKGGQLMKKVALKETAEGGASKEKKVREKKGK
ncbi:MAG TPA: M14 family metallopeptidase [Thermoanaerobaculia bacterium]